MPAPRKTDGLTLALLVAMYAALAGNFWLHRKAPLPLAVHVVIATAAIHLAFTIWHEAVHRNLSHRLWINHVVGVLGMLPYMTPYFMQRWIHLEHHARLNEREDPNFVYIDGPFWKIPLRYPRALGYARKLLTRDPRAPAERVSDALSLGVVASAFALAWWFGALTELVWLWLVPVVLAKLIMDWYINYLPHAGLPPHRFRGTRIVDAAWLTPLVLAHNYHAIHHLWPTIPWHGYRAAFREKQDYLRQHGVPIEHGIAGSGTGTGVFSPGASPPR
jgi:ring-1,2-phenylacetyl-CoA epoxidase subunit PaaE